MKSLLLCVAALLIFSCRQRESQLKLKSPLASFLRLENLPFKERIKFCSQDILILYVGNAEGMGDVEIFPNFKSLFNKNNYFKNWQKAEREREKSYFEKVTKEAKKLAAITAKEDAGCSDPKFVSQLKPNQRLGSVSIVALLDGPNHGTKFDSSLLTWTHKYVSSAGSWKWNPQVKPTKWLVNGRGITSNPKSTGFEVLVPESMDEIIKWALFKFPKTTRLTRSFTQTFYFLKSHGGRLEDSPANGPLGENLQTKLASLGGRVGKKYDPSLFLFDANGPGGRLNSTDYFVNLWSPTTYCGALEKFSRIQSQEECIRSIITQLTSEKIISGRGRKGSQGRGRKGSQGAIGLFDTSRVPRYVLGKGFWTNGTQGNDKSQILGGGKVFPSEKIYVDGKDEPIFSEKAFQKYWGSLRLPLSREMIKKNLRKPSDTNFRPEAIRFLGKAKTLFESDRSRLSYDGRFNANPFSFYIGSQRDSMVVFDTCSSNVQYMGYFYKKGLIKNNRNGSETIFLANPNPLLIDALNYGILNGFQHSLLQSYLRMLIDGKADKKIKEGLVESLTGEIKPTKFDRDHIRKRLLISSYDCHWKYGGSQTPYSCSSKTFQLALFDREETLLAGGEYLQSLREFLENPSEFKEKEVSSRSIKYWNSPNHSHEASYDDPFLWVHYRLFSWSFEHGEYLHHLKLVKKSNYRRLFKKLFLQAIREELRYLKSHDQFSNSVLPSFRYFDIYKIFFAMQMERMLSAGNLKPGHIKKSIPNFHHWYIFPMGPWVGLVQQIEEFEKTIAKIDRSLKASTKFKNGVLPSEGLLSKAKNSANILMNLTKKPLKGDESFENRKRQYLNELGKFKKTYESWLKKTIPELRK